MLAPSGLDRPLGAPETTRSDMTLSADGLQRRARDRRTQAPSGARMALITAVMVVAPVGGLAAFVFLGQSDPIPLARLSSADAHALAFDPQDADRLLFGHHGGLLESSDGGRTWAAGTLAAGDAMNINVGGDGSVQIAGHELYVGSQDSGATWQPIDNDLPGLDLHSYVGDPAEPGHAWTFAAGYGLFETTDGGASWELRQEGNWGALKAYRRADRTILVGIGPEGLAESSDAGGTWTLLAYPGAPLSGGLAVAADGSAIYAATIRGLRRSDDGGASWRSTGWETPALAVAVSPMDPSLLVAVDDAMNVYRSTDGGASWPGG